MLDGDIERRIKRLTSGPSGAAPGQDQESPEIFDFLDTLIAVPRGVGNAVGEVYDLADTLTFDILPDTPDGRLFGESQSVVGGLVEGVAQFATGFIPGVKFLSAGGKITKGRKIAKGLSTAAELARKAATGSGRSIAILRSAVAGVAADLTVFDGHETRLSNLIQDHPSLANPVTEFLAADDDDGEIEGRLKSALEGLGIGFAIDGVTAASRSIFSGDGALAGLKGVKKSREILAEGGSKEAASEAGQKAYEEALEDGATKVADGVTLDDILDEPSSPFETVEKFGFTKETVLGAVERAKEIKASGLDPRVNPRTLINEDPLGAFHRDLIGSELNLSQFPTHDEGALLRGLEETFLEGGLGDLPGAKAVEFARTPQSLSDIDLQALQQVADVSSQDPATILASLGADLPKDLEGANRLQARIHAISYAQVLTGERISQLSKKIAAGVDVTPEDEASLLVMFELMANTAASADAARSQAGRLLRSLNGPVATTPISDLRALIESSGGSDRVRKVAQKALEVAEESGTVGLGKIANRAQNGLAITQEYWINALLSGPKTQIVNGLSNFLVSVYRPFEKIAGGAAGRLFTNDQGAKDTFEVGLHELSGLYHGFKESVGVAARSFKDNSPILDPSFSKVDINEGLKTAAQGATDPSTLSGTGHMISALGKVMRLPTRLLSTTDELFKQMNFRSSLYAELHLKASKEGIKSADIPEFISKNFANYIENGQALTTRDAYKKAIKLADDSGIPRSDPSFKPTVSQRVSADFDSGIAQRALESAREGTFTSELAKGTLGRDAQNFINAHPSLRFAMPFIRTPINLLKFAGQRLDAPGFAAAFAASKSPKLAKSLAASNNRVIQDALSDDPRRKFEALGRLSLGFGAVTYFLNQATAGSITGRGPTDPTHRKLLESTGWKPYSILVGSSYVSYQRIDPFSTVIGLAADLATYGQYADIDDQTDGEVLLGSFVSALSNNITQKSYLTGLSNIVGVLEDPVRNGQKYIQQFGSSFVPNVLNQAEDVSDPHLREVRSMMDAFQSKIPGLSNDLPAIRNILGEKVTKPRSLGSDSTADITNFFLPIQYSSVSSATIEKELLELGHGFSVPSRIQGGVDLTTLKDANGIGLYDRFQALTGTEKVYGKTLRESLNRLIKSKRYQSLPVEGIEGERSPRVGEISKILRRFRHASIEKLRREVPELKEQTRVQRRARLGFSTALTQ